MILRRSEAVAHSCALVGQTEDVIKGLAGLRLLMEKFGCKRHILQTVHDLIRAYGNSVEAVYGLKQISCIF